MEGDRTEPVDSLRRDLLRTGAGFAIVGVGLGACSGDEQRRTLRAADTQVASYPTVQAVEWMGRELERETGGRIRIKTYPGRQLGEESDTLQQTVFGAVDINRINITALTNVVPETNVITLPFIFQSTAHRDRVLHGEIGREILSALEPYGLIGLAFYDSGARSIYTADRDVRSPADLAGLRIRVQNSDVAVAMVQALGANATPMEFGQVYEAIRNGAVDGAENNWPSFVDTRHFEVAPHYSLTQHSMAPEVLVMSNRTWQRFGEKDRELIRETAQRSIEVMSGLWAERVREARAIAAAAGVIVVDVRKAAFLDAVKPVYERFASNPASAALVRRIQAVAQ